MVIIAGPMHGGLNCAPVSLGGCSSVPPGIGKCPDASHYSSPLYPRYMNIGLDPYGGCTE